MLELDYQKWVLSGALFRAIEALPALADEGIAVTMVSHETGADREQWRFELGDESYLILVEHLSESLWIESLPELPLPRLQFFYNLLTCQ